MSHLQTTFPEPHALPFDADLALRFARLPRRARGYERMKKHVSELAEAYRDQIHASVRIGWFPIDQFDAAVGSVSVAGRLLDGAGLIRRLEGCDEIACYVATLGPEIDAIMARLRIEDFSEAFLLDAVASAFVQRLQDLALEDISTDARARGRRVKPRHAPGYHGWPLSGQEALLDLLDAAALGVRLTDGFLMLPQKSVSGACGLEPVGIPARSDNP